MTRLRRHLAWPSAAAVAGRHRLLAFALLVGLVGLVGLPPAARAQESEADAEPAPPSAPPVAAVVVHEAPDVPQRVPETGTAGAMKTSVIEITDEDEACGAEGATVRDVDVRLDLLHDFNADLTVWLTSPEGTTIALFSRLGGGTQGMSVILDDEAPEEIAGSVTDFTARRPQTPLSGPGLCRLDGQSAVGAWKLDVHDWLGGGTGYLSNWALTLTCGTEGVAQPCAAAASPGEEPDEEQDGEPSDDPAGAADSEEAP